MNKDKQVNILMVCTMIFVVLVGMIFYYTKDQRRENEIEKQIAYARINDGEQISREEAIRRIENSIF